MRNASGQTSEASSDLIEKAQNGDEKAFTEIVRRYERLVYNFSFKVCRNREHAEETLQNTFINVFRKLNQFDGKSKFSTWLYSIVINSCLMKRRRRKLEEASFSIDDEKIFRHDDARPGNQTEQHPALQSWRHTPLEEAMTKELRKRLDEVILKLPIDHRLVFILRDIEGQSAEETGKIMKLTIPAVKSRLRRARMFLREQLNEYMTS